MQNTAFTQAVRVILAFGNKVALTADPVSIGATCASALPTHSRSSWGPHDILRHSMFALFPQCGDTSGASLGVRSVALLHGRLSVVGRWNRARYKRSKRVGNLNKKHFSWKYPNEIRG